MSEVRPGSSNARVFWGAALTVVVLDVVTKWIVQHTLTPLEPLRIFGEFVRFTLVYNRGAAFSMSLGTNSRWIFGTFAAIALFILWRLYRQSAPGDRARALALGLAWGGAAGNLIDRIREPRGVVDFIDVGVGTVRFWTFNVADSAVTVGAFLLAWVLWHEDRKQSAAHAAAAKTTEVVEERTGA
ncbi:MAG TPA: signal peptidase II [Gemmatimonadaceae bacterium]